MGALFQNGKRRITRLVILELGCGLLIMCILQIQGQLMGQDWMSPRVMKETAFVLGILGTLLKGAEMFFSKTASMYKTGEISSGDTNPPFLPNPPK